MIESDALAIGLDESPRRLSRLSHRRNQKVLGLDRQLRLEGQSDDPVMDSKAVHIDATQERFESDWRQMLERGSSYVDQGKLHLGVSFLTRVVNRAPEHAAAWHRLGFAYGEMGRRREAMLCFDKVISLQPDWAEAWNNRGWNKMRVRRYEDAIEDFKEALEIDSTSAMTWSNLAIAYVKTNDDRSASHALRMASTLDGKNEVLWFRWAICCARLGDRAGAARGFRQATIVNPCHLPAWIHLLMRIGDIRALPKPVEPLVTYQPSEASSQQAFPNVGKVLVTDSLSSSHRGTDPKPKFQIAWRAIQNPVAWILVLVFASLLYIVLGK